MYTEVSVLFCFLLLAVVCETECIYELKMYSLLTVSIDKLCNDVKILKRTSITSVSILF